MKKISTLFKKDPNNLGRVINEVNPENEWVFKGEGIATRKYDGSACSIINGKLYKRYDVKNGKAVPEEAIPCQEPDPISGHWPHWVKCQRDKPEDRFLFEAFDLLISSYAPIYANELDGTYEFCGPKSQGNPEGFEVNVLVRHGMSKIEVNDYSFEGLKELLIKLDIEGIVFHHRSDGRMCKIRKSDFGIRRTPKTSR